eukprot:CAMPEP_0174993424 /NCGR_PEP_ID=MMETSP0004_2-20121128/23068_1 /TAXON_ID=420556 /ORGANISM="Ochromonas sp., Strain CCMP1393" /LENGTH=142 /DNA_ID=CAMNT_0016247539 /DNA_START=145 /DNA_END=573 /DNA_ORIENTATION=+
MKRCSNSSDLVSLEERCLKRNRSDDTLSPSISIAGSYESLRSEVSDLADELSSMSTRATADSKPSSPQKPHQLFYKDIPPTIPSPSMGDEDYKNHRSLEHSLYQDDSKTSYCQASDKRNGANRSSRSLSDRRRSFSSAAITV